MGSIRFLLAISVVIAHTSSVYGFELVGGELAVKLFFMISGFYMALILNEKYIGEHGSYKLFIKNRLLRLFPLYFLVLFLTIIINYFGYTINPSLQSAYGNLLIYGNQFDIISWVYFAATNGLMIGMDSSLFLGLNPDTGHLFFTTDFNLHQPKVYSFLFVPQSWSISIELMFYFIAPFIVRRLKLILAFLLISLAISFLLMLYDLPSDPWNYRFFPSQLMYFMGGAVGYFIYKKEKLFSKVISNRLKWIVFSLTLFFTIFYSFINQYVDSYILSMVLILLYLMAIPLVFDLSKQWKKDRIIGELSYSIYMVHILVIYCIKLTGITHFFIFGLSEMVIAATIFVSFLVQKIFLDRIEKFRKI